MKEGMKIYLRQFIERYYDR